MFKRIFLVLCTATLFATSAQSQLADKATFFGGFGYHVVATQPLGNPSPFQYYFYGLGMGMDYVLAHSNDMFSIGFNPNVNFCFQFNNLSGISLLGQVPVFLLARVGAGATPYNEQKVGVGAGIGINQTFIRHDGFARDQNSNLYDLKYRHIFFNPSAVVEFSIRSRISDYIFRFNWSLMKPQLDVPVPNQGIDLPMRFGVAGLSVMYSF